MNRRRYRRAWLRAKERYERRGRAIFRRTFRKIAEQIPIDNLKPWNYQALILLNVGTGEIQQALLETYTQIGLAHGNRVGREINKHFKRFEPSSFDDDFRKFIQQWLLNNGGQRITSMQKGFSEFLIKFIASKLEEDTTIDEIVREFRQLFKSRRFYRWQIERIVRTETTAAANMGAVLSGSSSGVVMEKVWISSNDSRTRQHEKGDQFDHIDMDGIRVGENERFNVQGDLLRFPGDPNGQPGNIINCRCAVALVPKRDASGRLVFKPSQVALV